MSDENMQSRCRAIESCRAIHERDIYHIERRLDDIEKLVNAKMETVDSKFKAQQQAVETARDTLDIRLESMNEFRAQMGDQVQLFASRDIVDRNHKEVIERLGDVENRMAGLDARIAAWSAAVGLALYIATQVFGLGG